MRPSIKQSVFPFANDYLKPIDGDIVFEARKDAKNTVDKIRDEINIIRERKRLGGRDNVMSMTRQFNRQTEVFYVWQNHHIYEQI